MCWIVWGALFDGNPLLLGYVHSGFMRCWGRDTFISLRGLMMTTGRWEEARSVLLSFASVVRHGLVPNLMDSGRNPRFNARDATWWFLQVCVFAGHGARNTPGKQGGG